MGKRILTENDIDLTYNPESENIQSGKAVAGAIAETVGNINTVLATLVEVE